MSFLQILALILANIALVILIFSWSQHGVTQECKYTDQCLDKKTKEKASNTVIKDEELTKEVSEVKLLEELKENVSKLEINNLSKERIIKDIQSELDYEKHKLLRRLGEREFSKLTEDKNQ